MTNSLFLLARLTDRDLDLLLADGWRESCPVGHQLITLDEEVRGLSLLLEGGMEARGYDGQRIRTIYPGELVGEVSFLDGRPASASVIAIEPSEVITVPRRRLQARLDADPAFGMRFYRALGSLLAWRLRDLTARKSGAPSAADEIDAETLDAADLATRRLETLMRRLRQR